MASGTGEVDVEGDGSDIVAQNVVAIFHASFHPTKGNTIDWSLTSPSSSSSSIDLTGVEFSVLPSGLHLVSSDVVYFTHLSYTGLALFRRRATKSRAHRGFRLGSLGILLEESERPRPWMYLKALRRLADEVYREADRREREEEDGAEDLLGLGAPGDLREEDFEPARQWLERRKVAQKASSPVDVWSGWSDELDGTHASKATPTYHLPHLLRILGLSSLTLYKFVLSRRRILIYTLPPVEVAGVLAWIAADLCREHHMAPRQRSQEHILGTPMPTLFKDSTPPSTSKEDTGVEEESRTDKSESPTVLGMITLNDLSRLEAESAKGKGWIACTTDAIFMEKPQYYDLIIDLTTSTPSKASRPSLYMSKAVSASGGGGGGGMGGRRKEKWKLESVRFTWSDVKLWTELDRILKLDSSQTSSHHHHHTSSAGPGSCCLPGPKSAHPSSPTPGSSQGAWADAFRIYEDVCLLCATLWMGLGTWRSNSRQSFASRDVVDDRGRRRERGGSRMTTEWGAAREPGDEDWSMEGTHMRALGMGIEGNPASRRKDKDKDKDKGKDNDVGTKTKTKIRTVGMGIEGKPRRLKSQAYTQGLGMGIGHSRKASSTSANTGTTKTASMKIPGSISAHIEAVDEGAEQGEGEMDGYGPYAEDEEEDHAEEMRRQTVQTTLALLQTFHANTVFWLSRLREVIPPPSADSSPSPHSPISGPSPSSRAYSRLSQDENDQGDEEEEEEETLIITARDLLSLELGVLSDLDARFVEWLVEAEGYSSPASESLSTRASSSVRNSRLTPRHGRRRRVVVKRGWQELFGILLGLK